MLKKTALALSLSVILSGCAATKVCEPNYKVDISASEQPAKTAEDKKIIVLPIEIGFKDPAAKKIQSVLRNELESQIVKSGTNLVDRKIANKLKNELRLAEQSGRYNTKGVSIADFAVLTEITASDLKTSFSKARTYKNDDGETVKVAAKCSYEVDVSAIAKVVTLPDMQLIKRIELKGDQSMSSETNNSNCPVSDARYSGLASEAAAEAVQHDKELKLLLALSAPVQELRQCDAGTMVRIAIGSNNNIQPGTEIAFSKAIQNMDGEIETFSVGEGTVVDVPLHGIKAKYSWVEITEELALKINKGDEAKIVPEVCPILDIQCQAKLQLGDLI
jgi:PBP1b-binding outer membrane lipoprotein LpoB